MFIAILTYKKPLEEVDRFLQAHRDYLAKHYAVGDFIASGPQTPRVGGVIMIKADNRATVDAIIANDPFNINRIAEYQIVEFTPTMFCDDNSILPDIIVRIGAQHIIRETFAANVRLRAVFSDMK